MKIEGSMNVQALQDKLHLSEKKSQRKRKQLLTENQELKHQIKQSTIQLQTKLNEILQIKQKQSIQ